jgi:hypothetical protein
MTSDAALPRRTHEPLDAPDAATLIDAVASWLHDDLLPRTEGADRWQVRIAANALRVAVREVREGPALVEAHRERLAALGYANDRALCEAIRAGETDDRFAAVLDAIATSVEASLAIANPGYAGEARGP